MTATPLMERQRWMAVLARASVVEIEHHLGDCGPLPVYTRLRGPEVGLVMVQGRTGGGGGPFNMGEMTVSRCAVRTEIGLTGHAYVAGRDLRQAELAAVLDGALQDASRHDLRSGLIEPLAKNQAEQRAQLGARAAATRVQFFTMATMRE